MSSIPDPLFDIVIREMPTLAVSMTSSIVGLAIVFDDAKDFGKTDRITHHVYTGLVPLIGGFAGIAVSIYKIWFEYTKALASQPFNTPQYKITQEGQSNGQPQEAQK